MYEQGIQKGMYRRDPRQAVTVQKLQARGLGMGVVSDGPPIKVALNRVRGCSLGPSSHEQGSRGGRAGKAGLSCIWL